MQKGIICLVFALTLCASTRASLTLNFPTQDNISYPSPYNQSLSPVTGQPSSIETALLTLTFDGSAGLHTPGSDTPFPPMTVTLTLSSEGVALGTFSSSDMAVVLNDDESWTYSMDLSSSSYFGDLNPNNTWSLTLGFPNVGGPSSYPANDLIGGELDITAVPEPITWALIIFGVGGLLLALGRWCWCRFSLHNSAESR